MDSEEPGGEDIEEVVKAVGVCDTVDGGVQRREKHEEVRDVSYTVGLSAKSMEEQRVVETAKKTRTYRPVTLGVI